jgi:hypothetical protein
VWLTTWDVDVLLEAINQLVCNSDWQSILRIF